MRWPEPPQFRSRESRTGSVPPHVDNPRCPSAADRPSGRHRARKPSYEDSRRGMSRGTNHSTPRSTKDTRREQKAQAGPRKAAVITRSAGLRRRERRSESCRGHRVLPAYISQRNHRKQRLKHPRGIVRGTNSFHEPLHASDSTPCRGRVDDQEISNALVSGLYVVGGRRWAATIRGGDARS